MSIPVYFWFPVLGTTVLGTFFMNISPVADQFMRLFGVGYAGLSFFLSGIIWTHALFQVPGGLIADRLGTFRTLLLCVVLLIAGNLLPFLAPESLPLAVGMRFTLGLATGMAFLVMVKIVKILTPPSRVARMQGMLGGAFCLGTMLPYLYLPLAGPYGWVAAYLTGAVFSAIIGLCMFRLPLEKLRETRETVSLSQMWQATKDISTSKLLWVVGCCHGFSYGTLNTLGNWLPSILADTRASGSPEDWAVATSVMLLAGTVARMFGSEVIGYMTRWQIITRVTFLTGVSYLILAALGNPVAVFCLTVVMALLCGITFSSVFTVLIDTAPPAYVATSVGFMNMLANGVNILLILIWGMAREYTGGFAVGLCLSGVCALLLWCIARRLDLNYLDK